MDSNMLTSILCFTLIILMAGGTLAICKYDNQIEKFAKKFREGE